MGGSVNNLITGSGLSQTHAAQVTSSSNQKVSPSPGPPLLCLGGESFLDPWEGSCSSLGPLQRAPAFVLWPGWDLR